MRSAPFNHDLTLSGRPTLALLLQPAIIGEYLYRLWRTYRERQRLADLEPRLLRDIGIDPLAAAYEIERPFWQLSAHHEAAFRRRLTR